MRTCDTQERERGDGGGRGDGGRVGGVDRQVKCKVNMDIFR